MKRAKTKKRIGYLLIMLCFMLSLSGQLFQPKKALGLSSQEIKNNLDSYNVVWTSQSANSSESMPVGGGDIGCNVWVENNNLWMYISKSDAYDENNQFLKLGRLKVEFIGFTFNTFRQELKLADGYVTVSGSNTAGDTISADIWVDINTSTVNIDIDSSEAISVLAEYQSWRYNDRTITTNGGAFESDKATADYIMGYRGDVVKSKDMISSSSDKVEFYHQNNRLYNVVDLLVHQQKLAEAAGEIWDPLGNRIFGGIMVSDDFITAKEGGVEKVNQGNYNDFSYKGFPLISKQAAAKQSIKIFTQTGQYDFITGWRTDINAKINSYNAQTAKTASKEWWNNYFDRSYIFVNSGADASNSAWQVGRNYQLFRYMLGCNALGSMPSKFNGGMFTFDTPNVKTGYYDPDSSGYGDPDFRLWGGGTHTQQNQRLLYWPMLKSGDFDMMPQQLSLYDQSYATSETTVRTYWGHSGPMYTEQTNFFGLPSGNHYGWERNINEVWDLGVTAEGYGRYHHSTQIEFAKMMLDYHRYSGADISQYIDYIESNLAFFQEHFRMMYRQLTGTASGYDTNGKLVIYPSTAMETYKNIVNPVELIIGIKEVAADLLALESEYPQIDDARWVDLLPRIPEPFTDADPLTGNTVIMPGSNPGSLDKFYTGADNGKYWQQNIEKPQMYAVYPYNLYGLGKPDLQVAVDTNLMYEDDWGESWSQNSHISWHQNAIFAARLGDVENAEYFTVKKLQNSTSYKFPSFWGPGHDWVPDHNWGGSGMIGLQEMVMQSDPDGTIRPFAALPLDWNTDYKLHATDKTVVEGSIHNGEIGLKISVAADSARNIIKLNIPTMGSVTVTKGSGGTVSYSAHDDVNGDSGNLISWACEPGETYTVTDVSARVEQNRINVLDYDFASGNLTDSIVSNAATITNGTSGANSSGVNGITLTNNARINIPYTDKMSWKDDFRYETEFTVNQMPEYQTHATWGYSRILDSSVMWGSANFTVDMHTDGRVRLIIDGKTLESSAGLIQPGVRNKLLFNVSRQVVKLDINGTILTVRADRKAPPALRLPVYFGADGDGTEGHKSITFHTFRATCLTERNTAGIYLETLAEIPMDAISGGMVTGCTGATAAVQGTNIGLNSGRGLEFSSSGKGRVLVSNPASGEKLDDFAMELSINMGYGFPGGKSDDMALFDWSDGGTPLKGVALYLTKDGKLTLKYGHNTVTSTRAMSFNWNWQTIRLTYSLSRDSYEVTIDDNVFLSGSAFSIDDYVKTASISFGMDANSSTNAFAGYMDNVVISRILDSAPPPEEPETPEDPIGLDCEKVLTVDLDITSVNSGKITNNAGTDADCGNSVSNGLTFDGTGLVEVRAPSGGKNTDSFVIEMSVKLTALSDTVSLWDWSWGSDGIHMRVGTDGKITVAFGTKTYTTSSAVLSLNTKAETEFIYNHVQGTFWLYVDDAVVLSGETADLSGYISTNGLWLGCATDGYKYALTGIIDIFKVYRIQTVEPIGADYEKVLITDLDVNGVDTPGSGKITNNEGADAEYGGGVTDGLDFDGTGVVYVKKDASWANTQSFVIEMSVTPDTIGATVSLWDWSYGNEGIYMRADSDGKITVAFASETHTTATAVLSARTKAETEFVYNHVKGKFWLYIDGSIVLSGDTADLSGYISSNDIWLGCATDGYQFPLDGLIDVFKVYRIQPEDPGEPPVEPEYEQVLAVDLDTSSKSGNAITNKEGGTVNSDNITIVGGGGLEFNGNGVAYITNPMKSVSTHSFAVEMSVKITQNIQMALWDWCDNGWPTNGIVMRVKADGTIAVITGYSEYASTAAIPLNQQVSIVFTYDHYAGTWSVSLDGATVLNGTTVDLSGYISTHDMWLGCGTDWNNAMKGTVYAFKVYRIQPVVAG